MASVPLDPTSDEYARRRDRARDELRALGVAGLGAVLDGELAADAARILKRWQARKDELQAELSKVNEQIVYWKSVSGG